MLVTLPYDRVIRIAIEQAEGEQTCPKRGHVCFNERGLKSYVPEKSECTACWVQYLLNEN